MKGNDIMNIFGEIERLITEHGSATILRQRLELAKEQYSALENKVTELRSENDNLRLQLQQSQQQIEELNKSLPSASEKRSDFDDTTHKILKTFFNRSDNICVDEAAEYVGIDRAIARYHFDLLMEADFIILTRMGSEGWDGSSPAMYGITAKGRKYVVKNKI